MGNENWLPHLPAEVTVGARNNNLCSYLIALEGWRRGLTLKYYSRRVKRDSLHAPGLLFTLSDGEDTHTFYKSRGMRVKREAFSIGGNKFKMKELLSKNNIPIAKGEMFLKKETDQSIIQYAKELGYPVVVKPTNAAQGKGVIANIENEEKLKKALKYVREDLKYQDVILEQSVTGKEFRIYVVKDKVVAVLNRVPANVIGDGKHTIRELVQHKNKDRMKNPRLRNCLIYIDFEIESLLDKSGYTLDTVLNNKEQFFLREKSNTSSGGDSVDYTDKLPTEIKEMAVNTLKAVPNFPHGGVDMMIDLSNGTLKSAYVIELTPVPQIGSHLFPMQGQARDIPSAIIDFYFPKTKHKKNSNPNMYFDLRDVLAPLNSKSAEEITVTKCPTNITYAKKYIIKGKVQKVGFRRWIRKKALEADLYGHARNLNNGILEVMIAGTEEKVEQFKEVCKTGPQKSSVTNVEESVWTRPIKVGFEIKPTQKKRIKKEVKKIEKKATFFQKISRRFKGKK